MAELLTIGKLSRRSDVSIDSIRFYERKGLLEEPQRTDSNYRIYSLNAAKRLRFIKKSQKLGFSLEEIQELLRLSHDSSASKADIKRITEDKIADIRTRIQDLNRMLQALERLDGCCDGNGPATECSILKSLAEPEEDDVCRCGDRRHQEQKHNTNTTTKGAGK